MGLIVDQSKSRGIGNSNDGNTARFFRESSKSSAITDIREELIKHFETILRIISCVFPVNIEKFDAFNSEKIKLHLSFYP